MSNADFMRLYLGNMLTSIKLRYRQVKTMNNMPNQLFIIGYKPGSQHESDKKLMYKIFSYEVFYPFYPILHSTKFKKNIKFLGFWVCNI